MPDQPPSRPFDLATQTGRSPRDPGLFVAGDETHRLVRDLYAAVCLASDDRDHALRADCVTDDAILEIVGGRTFVGHDAILATQTVSSPFRHLSFNHWLYRCAEGRAPVRATFWSSTMREVSSLKVGTTTTS